MRKNIFSKLKYVFIVVAFCLSMANAASIVAVLEITPSDKAANLSLSEFRHLTDELRARARETLPTGYSILTRDNIIQLLPPDEKEAECLAESCAVDIGRAIGAEYVTQGFIGKFEGMLTLTVELYESMSGNMLGSFVTESENARGLLATIREKAPAMFAKIAEKNKAKDVQIAKQITASEAVPASISTNINTEAKKDEASGLGWRSITRIASFSLAGIFGAAAIYKHSESKDRLKELDKLKTPSGDIYEWKGQYNAKTDEIREKESQRNIFGISAGVCAIAGGVTFFF